MSLFSSEFILKSLISFGISVLFSKSRIKLPHNTISLKKEVYLCSNYPFEYLTEGYIDTWARTLLPCEMSLDKLLVMKIVPMLRISLVFGP